MFIYSQDSLPTNWDSAQLDIINNMKKWKYALIIPTHITRWDLKARAGGAKGKKITVYVNTLRPRQNC